MKRILLVLSILFLSISGCGRFDPLSPKLEQKIDNQNGKIDELKNNQNGVSLELMKLRQQTDLNARDIDNFQQGAVNLRGASNDNTGFQLIQGDGALMLIFGLGVIGMFFVYHYRTEALKNSKTANILAQQIAAHDDVNLDEKVFTAAMNSDVEEHVYQLMVKNQALAGKKI